MPIPPKTQARGSRKAHAAVIRKAHAAGQKNPNQDISPDDLNEMLADLASAQNQGPDGDDDGDMGDLS